MAMASLPVLKSAWKWHLQWIFIQIYISYILLSSSISDLKYQKYTFYYETSQYSLSPIDLELEMIENKHTEEKFTDFHIANDTNAISSDQSISFDIPLTDNITVNILKTNGRPYIVNILDESGINDENNNKNTKQIEPLYSFDYDNYDNFNYIDIWYTPHRERRRLRLCAWTQTYFCGHSYTRYKCGGHHQRYRCGRYKWGWSWWTKWCYRWKTHYCTRRHSHYCTRRHEYYCAPIAPPRSDTYWLARWNRKGRFIAYYPSIHRIHHYNYRGCSRLCTAYYGGLASIHSNLEASMSNDACYQILINPKASNQRDHDGNWRGHSCYIGLRRPFHHWDDKRKVKYTNWYVIVICVF